MHGLPKPAGNVKSSSLAASVMSPSYDRPPMDHEGVLVQIPSQADPCKVFMPREALSERDIITCSLLETGPETPPFSNAAKCTPLPRATGSLDATHTEILGNALFGTDTGRLDNFDRYFLRACLCPAVPEKPELPGGACYCMKLITPPPRHLPPSPAPGAPVAPHSYVVLLPAPPVLGTNLSPVDDPASDPRSSDSDSDIQRESMLPGAPAEALSAINVDTGSDSDTTAEPQAVTCRHRPLPPVGKPPPSTTDPTPHRWCETHPPTRSILPGRGTSLISGWRRSPNPAHPMCSTNPTRQHRPGSINSRKDESIMQTTSTCGSRIGRLCSPLCTPLSPTGSACGGTARAAHSRHTLSAAACSSSSVSKATGSELLALALRWKSCVAFTTPPSLAMVAVTRLWLGCRNATFGRTCVQTSTTF